MVLSGLRGVRARTKVARHQDGLHVVPEQPNLKVGRAQLEHPVVALTILGAAAPLTAVILRGTGRSLDAQQLLHGGGPVTSNGLLERSGALHQCVQALTHGLGCHLGAWGGLVMHAVEGNWLKVLLHLIHAVHIHDGPVTTAGKPVAHVGSVEALDDLAAGGVHRLVLDEHLAVAGARRLDLGDDHGSRAHGAAACLRVLDLAGDTP